MPSALATSRLLPTLLLNPGCRVKAELLENGGGILWKTGHWVGEELDLRVKAICSDQCQQCEIEVKPPARGVRDVLPQAHRGLGIV